MITKTKEGSELFEKTSTKLAIFGFFGLSIASIVGMIWHIFEDKNAPVILYVFIIFGLVIINFIFLWLLYSPEPTESLYIEHNIKNAKFFMSTNIDILLSESILYYYRATEDLKFKQEIRFGKTKKSFQLESKFRTDNISFQVILCKPVSETEFLENDSNQNRVRKLAWIWNTFDTFKLLCEIVRSNSTFFNLDPKENFIMNVKITFDENIVNIALRPQSKFMLDTASTVHPVYANVLEETSDFNSLTASNEMSYDDDSYSLPESNEKFNDDYNADINDRPVSRYQLPTITLSINNLPFELDNANLRTLTKNYKTKIQIVKTFINYFMEFCKIAFVDVKHTLDDNALLPNVCNPIIKFQQGNVCDFSFTDCNTQKQFEFSNISPINLKMSAWNLQLFRMFGYHTENLLFENEDEFNIYFQRRDTNLWACKEHLSNPHPNISDELYCEGIEGNNKESRMCSLIFETKLSLMIAFTVMSYYFQSEMHDSPQMINSLMFVKRFLSTLVSNGNEKRCVENCVFNNYTESLLEIIKFNAPKLNTDVICKNVFDWLKKNLNCFLSLGATKKSIL